MRKESKEKHFIHHPEYEGGPKALREFIARHLRYPKEALEQRIEGTVVVRYDIDQHGNVIEAKVLSGIGFGCDEEAVRLIKLLKYQVPKNRGLRVVFHKNLQINFRAPPPAPKPQVVLQPSVQVEYNYVQSAPKPGKEKPSGGYVITF